MSDSLPGPAKDSDWLKLVAMSEGAHTAARGAYTPKKVRARHRIAIMLEELGWKPGDIAKALGYKASRVSIILRSPDPRLRAVRAEFASEVAGNMQDTQMRMKLYANEMLDRLIDHARQKSDPGLSRLAARDILHMAGFSPVKKQFVVETKMPYEQLKPVINAIAEANEVVMKKGEWEVREAKSA